MSKHETEEEVVRLENSSVGDPVEESNAVAQYKPGQMTADFGDIASMSDEDREVMFQRKSDAEAADLQDMDLLNRELTLVRVTPFTRDVINKESGEMEVAQYVTFELKDGTTFRSASSQAYPFARDVAVYVGVDQTSGYLRRPAVIKITEHQATQGRIRKFKFIKFAD